jgi:hypothetical protein
VIFFCSIVVERHVAPVKRGTLETPLLLYLQHDGAPPHFARAVKKCRNYRLSHSCGLHAGQSDRSLVEHSHSRGQRVTAL